MIRVIPLETIDAKFIVFWSHGKDAKFLTQWSGRGYQYHLTVEQITVRLAADRADYKIYAIRENENLIGTIELMRIDLKAKRASIGRFLLDPAIAGKGYGAQALQLFVAQVFSETPINTLDLTVFDFNKSAIRCYEKSGFVKTTQTIRPNGWIAIQMEITKTNS
jgi:RimJ/RimL family protein N-acetyltransferase